MEGNMKKNNKASQGSSQGSSSSKYDDIEKYPPGGGPVIGIPKDRIDKVTSMIRKPKVEQPEQQKKSS